MPKNKGSNEAEKINDHVGDPHAVADPANHTHTIFRDMTKILRHLEAERLANVANHGSGHSNQGAPANQYDRVVFPENNYNNDGLLLNRVGGQGVNRDGYTAPGERMVGFNDDNDHDSQLANDVAMRSMHDQADRNIASLPAASDFVEALKAAMGQRENGPDLIQNSSTTAKEGKAKNVALGISLALGLTSTLGLVASLVYIFGYALPAKKDKAGAAPAKTGDPRVYDHMKIADDYTKPVIVNVLDNADGGAGTINKASLKLVEDIDANGPKLVDSIDLGTKGKWSIDAAKGQLVFTPGAKASGIQTSALFVVFDSSATPVQSNMARALVLFDMNDTPNRIPEDDGPKVFPVRSEGNTAGQKVTVDVLATAKKGLASIDKSTLTIATAIDDGKTLQVMGEGTWLVVGNTGTITFEPEKNFTGDPRHIRYSVADSMGQRSGTAPLTITYKGAAAGVARPVAKPAILPYELPKAGVAPAAVRVKLDDFVIKGASSIDWTRTALIGTQTPHGLGGNPMPAYENPLTENKEVVGYRKIRVPGQGTWTVEKNGTEIALAVDASAKGVPTSVSFSVGDANGRRSQAAFITPLTGADDIFKATDASNKKSDTQFWADLDAVRRKQTLTLEEWISIVIALQKVTQTGVGAASAQLLDVNGKHQITGAAFLALFKEWSQSSFSVDNLIAIAKREVTDTSVNLPKVPLATRLLRLSLMARLFRTYNSELLKMTGRGP